MYIKELEHLRHESVCTVIRMVDLIQWKLKKLNSRTVNPVEARFCIFYYKKMVVCSKDAAITILSWSVFESKIKNASFVHVSILMLYFVLFLTM